MCFNQIFTMAYSNADVLKGYKKIQENFKFDYTLKEEQCRPLLNILNGEHSLVVLPTGFGKSDIFMLAPLIKQVLTGERHHAIVIVPLLSLMADMVLKCKSRGVQLICVTQSCNMTKEEIEGVKKGIFSCWFHLKFCN